MSANTMANYRPEIDGLRSIAVLPVVLYHFGLKGFDGGFVGVDIFFVISGFLIGGILWSELDRTGRIRLGRFFMRRIRRLAPAYMIVAFVTLIGAWFVLLPFDFREFGQELIAATVYLANVHFFTDAGYFDQASDRKLLLHTWSLAVEEQFYLILPLLMLLLAGAKRVLPQVLVGLGLLSLIACLWMMAWSQPAAFYLFPFRAWELLAGVCLAIFGQRNGFTWQVHASVSWIGLALIVLAVFGFSAGDHFPGVYALVPVMGAVLIIANGQDQNFINHTLCRAPFLFFGLISYSLYLWHWPLVTLLKYYRGDAGLTPLLTITLLIVAISLSWMSLRFIETPVRKGGLSGWKLLTSYGISAIAVLGIAGSFAFSDGWPNRFVPEAHPYIAATRDFNQDWSRCHTPDAGPWQDIKICPIGPDGPPQVLVWGDSHARAFKEGLDLLADETNTAGLLIWRGGCPPLVDVLKTERVSSLAEEAACATSSEKILQGLKNAGSIETVLLIGRWAYYETGTGVGRDAHNWVTLTSKTSQTTDSLFAEALMATVSDLSTLTERVFILRQVPEITNYAAGTAARAIAYGQSSVPEIQIGLGRSLRRDLEARVAGADAAIDASASQVGASVINLWDDLCDAKVCSVYLDDVPVYFDNNHVTNTGARALRHRFGAVFEGAQ